MKISSVVRKVLQVSGIALITSLIIFALNVEHASAKPTFQVLWDNYPNGTSPDVSKSIGGKVEINNFSNTCVVRTSRAFNANAADLIPGPTEAAKYGMSVVSGSDKKWYAYRVSEFHKYMVSKYGNPVSSKGDGTNNPPTAILGKKGVIEFEFKFGDPSDPQNNGTGHFDIWDGKACKENCYFERVDNTKNIYLWAFN